MDEAWMDFMVSGKVTDYLRFKNAESERGEQMSSAYLQEERPDGTEYYSDRYGLTGNANWRV